MNKTAIKNFAVWARQKLISDITYKAGMLGVTESGIAEKLPQSTADLYFFDIGTKNYAEVAGREISQRSALVDAIRIKEKDTGNYKEAFESVVEEVAYTWFNRLIAIRFMEVNGYLPSGIRVLSSENKAKNEPDFVTNPFDTDLELTAYEQDRVIQLKDENKLDELFRMLFIKQCNKLHDILPELFEKTDDYTELLLTISFTDKDGIVYHLTHDIDEDDFNVEKEGQVEIIGWMYQYYNIEPKAAVFARASGKKISKEELPAVTQLFTPDWIVRYMVENSLGRIWIEGHPNDGLRDSWSYYIDEAEQESEVIAKLEEIRTSYKGLTPETMKIIDPCMGSGHILVYAFEVLMQIYESCGYTQRDAARSILKNNIFGLDIDKRAYQLAYFAVMMKARQYNRRILTEGIEPNLCFIKSSTHIRESALDRMEEYKNITQQLIADFRDADEYGSIMSVSLTETDLQNISNQLEIIKKNIGPGNLLDIIDSHELRVNLNPLIKQAKILATKYEVVVTNPPYMPVSNASAKLGDYVKKNYPDSKTDLFAVFIERCKGMLKINGYQAMITMHSWMFLSSYEKLREKMLMNDAVNMAHLGARAFEEIGGEVVQTTAFVRRNSSVKNYKGVYCRLIEPNTQQGKEGMFLDGENRYIADQSSFSKIPGSPIAYWVTQKTLEAYKSANLGEIAEPRHGLATSNNDLFLKRWFEVSIKKCSVYDLSNQSDYKWFPMNKGGSYRKWYGNNEWLINYENNGYEIKKYAAAIYKSASRTIQNTKYYFKQSLTWSALTSGSFSVRWSNEGAVFGSGGYSAFVDDKDIFYILALMNSKVNSIFIKIVSPTLNYEVGHIKTIPVVMESKTKNTVDSLTKELVNASKTDWDSFETSWDFQKHPFLENMAAIGYIDDDLDQMFTVESSYSGWKYICNERFKKLKANEEELNRIFIDIYGLQDELTPDVADKDITVHRVFDSKDDVPESMKGSNYIRTKRDEIVSLISYAVGCMLGRYSLDCDGIVFAGGTWDDGKYRTFIPDSDNCIPITDEEYFEDDIVGLFCAWLKKVYGEMTLEENLSFIADALGNKGNTSREVIRNYFLNDFIKDHIKTYQKRPIYWLFDSGKQNGFKALCYMHRWNADTTGNMRVEYLHRMQRVYEKEIERMQEIIDSSRDNKEIANATKRKEKLQKQIKETKEYDAKVAHLALSRIDIDLDDGVKVNYEKVQTASDGKKMQILAKI